MSEQATHHGVGTMSEAEKYAYYRELKLLLDQGWSQNQLAAHFGLSRGTIRRHIERLRGQESVKALAIPDEIPSLARAALVTLKDRDRKPLRGGRQTQVSGKPRLNQIVPPPEGGDWRLENITPEELRRMAPADLIARIIRVSPEMSRAYYDYLRMANPGWSLKAFKPTGKGSPDKRGQEYLDLCIVVLGEKHGSADVVWNQMLSNQFVRGALFAEVVLAKDARSFADIVVPDAYSARFRVVKDPDIGGLKYQLVQGTGRDEKVLDSPTIKYIPVDPLPDSPYGTSIIAPGLFPSIFLITMLQDARRVVAQQGWPRLDISIEVAEMIESMPEKDRDDVQKIKAYIDRAVEEVQAAYSELDPDQAWVHTSTVKFGDPIGAIGNLEGIDSLVLLLERMAVRALKSMPLLFGMPEGVSEANANRQWEVHVAGVRSMQRLAEQTISGFFTLALEAAGINAIAEFKFEELRASEELRDAQILFQKLENAQRAELLGYMEHDEASIYAVGHPAAETPIGVVGDEEDQPADGADGGTENPEGGAVMEGDTGDEKPPKGDDGATLAKSNGHQRGITRAQLATLVGVLSDPKKAEAMVYALSALSGHRAPKIDPKGDVSTTGDEKVKLDKTDLAAADRDFNFRVGKRYKGMLQAVPVDTP